MNRKRLVGVLAGGAMALFMPVVSLGQGAGGGGGGGGGGGSTVGSAAGALYGDLYIIERDGNGVPVTKTFTVAGVSYVCQQPIAADCSFLPLNGDKGADFDPELEDACAVQTDYVDGLQAVVFGRESVSRSPATVLDHSYAEALNNINAAEAHEACGGKAIKLDPAGRIELCLLADEATDTWAWKTIDSPLENLGLYRAVMTNGCLNSVTDQKVGEEGVPITVTYKLSDAAKTNLGAADLSHLVCALNGPEVVTKPDMLSAAVFIAAGADKFVPVSLDQIINVNNTLGVNKWTYTTSRKVKTLTIDYFQFKVTDGPGGWFAYTKGEDAFDPDDPANTVSLLALHAASGMFQVVPVPVFGTSPPGVSLTNVTVCRGGQPLTGVVCDNEAAPVYSTNNINGCGGANWFTQAAEHSRKTIWYLHNFEPPVLSY